MKKFILIIAMTGFFIQSHAQQLKLTDVPVTVTDAFTLENPTIKDADWSKVGNNYAAAFDVNQLEKSITYDPAGVLVGMNEEIIVSALPAPVMVYVQKNDEEAKVVGAHKNTDAIGTVTYEAKTVGNNLFFDSKGAFVKSEAN
jgi:hypothetical protein